MAENIKRIRIPRVLRTKLEENPPATVKMVLNNKILWGSN
jgi:hypothetical protein